ncbi:MAG: hypothetical protein Q8S06_11235, partial [Methanobacteriaceae archaeon]|nr:hypothetical protein [Methanobacteriaceae archaeon]
MSKNNEKQVNSHHQDSNVNSQAKSNINPAENSCGCGGEEDSKNYINSAENSCGCDEDSKNEPDKQDTCEIGESCSTCGCEEGLLEEKEQIWDRKPLLIISTSAIL